MAKTITSIAAVARNRVIGNAGAIPWHIPAEFAHFKATTLGHTLIMGRSTYESIGRPLPGRTTIMLTRGPMRPLDGVLMASDLASAIRIAEEQPGEVFIAGGATVYADALAMADTQLLSWIDAEPEGDTFYPDFSAADWPETSRAEHDGFTVVRYDRS